LWGWRNHASRGSTMTVRRRSSIRLPLLQFGESAWPGLAECRVAPDPARGQGPFGPVYLSRFSMAIGRPDRDGVASGSEAGRTRACQSVRHQSVGECRNREPGSPPSASDGAYLCFDVIHDGADIASSLKSMIRQRARETAHMFTRQDLPGDRRRHQRAGVSPTRTPVDSSSTG
jgi:hypothetical protein